MKRVSLLIGGEDFKHPTATSYEVTPNGVLHLYDEGSMIPKTSYKDWSAVSISEDDAQEQHS